MTSMKFMMIPTNLNSDRRWRALADNPLARLTYFGLLTSTKADYSGYFRYPLPIFEYEGMLSAGDLNAALLQLSQVGLIEHDDETEFVRIIGWYYGKYAPENISRLKALAKGYLRDDLPHLELTLSSIAEFVIGALVRSKSFKSAEKHTIEYHATLQKFVMDASVVFDGLRPALDREVELSGRDIKDMYELMVAPLSRGPSVMDGASRAPTGRVTSGCSHPAATVPSQKNKEEKEIDKMSQEVLGKAACTRPLQATLNSPLVKGMGMQ